MKTKSKVKVKSKRDETVIEGQWRATARYGGSGRKNTVPRRFVHNRGVRAIEDRRLEKKIVDLLRGGYEVRLFGGSVRFYHCVDKEFRSMYVAAATLADSRVRSCVHDIEFDFVRRDGRHDVQDVINLELDRRTAADEMPHVTPDTVVKCPECGATFRVGKALVQTKGEAASRRLFKMEVPLPTSGEDAASPLRNTRKRKETK